MIDRKAFRFFHENAGYVVGERAIGAAALARAEARLDEAIDNGSATVKWEWDDEPYDHGYMTDKEVAAKFESNEWTGPYGCTVTVGEETESLWGIVVGPRGTDDPYCRVIAAELAEEVFHQVDREAQERERAARMDIATV
jgi:hypothetical protein